MQFTARERESVRADLLARARHDHRIASGAITGSAASQREDDWSDVDLAFGIEAGTSLLEVLSDWTTYMYDRNAAVHHVDTRFANWVYRTFLLPNTLHVDLALVPSDHFQALGPSFKVVFGTSMEPARFDRPTSTQMHAACLTAAYSASVCTSKGALWQADHLLGIARDNALMSACLDHDLPYHHGRGFDLLPLAAKALYENAFAMTLDSNELRRALCAFSGTPDDAAPVSTSSLPELAEIDRGIGLGWLYALHARSSIARKKPWQAEYMVRGLRDYAFGLARLRLGGKPGLPLYPESVPERLDSRYRDTRLRALNLDELTRAFRMLIERLNDEISSAGVPQAARLQQTVSALM